MACPVNGHIKQCDPISHTAVRLGRYCFTDQTDFWYYFSYLLILLIRIKRLFIETATFKECQNVLNKYICMLTPNLH